MSSSQALIADDLLEAYPFVDHGTLLDVGGGSGDFLIAAAHRRPDLRVVLFDLPSVAVDAAARFKQERLGGRSSAVGGDFKRDALPAGAEIISLVRVAHDLDDAELDALLAKIFAALPPGGILLLGEPMAETAGAEKVGAYFEMYLLAMQRGRPRSAANLIEHLYSGRFHSSPPSVDAAPDAHRPARRAKKRWTAQSDRQTRLTSQSVSLELHSRACGTWDGRRM